jgi:hypothetical protein
MAGKRIGKFSKILFDTQDISILVQEISGLPRTFDEIEVSGFNQDKNYLSGQGDTDITLTMLFTTTATTGSHTIFAAKVGNNTGYALSVTLGNNVAATTGDPQFTGTVLVTDYQVLITRSGAQMCTTKLRPMADNAIPVWGTSA